MFTPCSVFFCALCSSQPLASSPHSVVSHAQHLFLLDALCPVLELTSCLSQRFPFLSLVLALPHFTLHWPTLCHPPQVPCFLHFLASFTSPHRSPLTSLFFAVFMLLTHLLHHSPQVPIAISWPHILQALPPRHRRSTATQPYTPLIRPNPTSSSSSSSNSSKTSCDRSACLRSQPCAGVRSAASFVLYPLPCPPPPPGSMRSCQPAPHADLVCV